MLIYYLITTNINHILFFFNTRHLSRSIKLIHRKSWKCFPNFPKIASTCTHKILFFKRKKFCSLRIFFFCSFCPFREKFCSWSDQTERLVFRETGVSRHNAGPMEAPLKPLNAIEYSDWPRVFRGGLNRDPWCRETPASQTAALRKLYLHFFSHWMGYNRGDGFPFNFEPNGIPFG